MLGACYSKLNYSLLLVSIYLVCRSKERNRTNFITLYPDIKHWQELISCDQLVRNNKNKFAL